MAFDFLGTFTKQDVEGLKSYLRGELNKVDAQTNNIILEINKHEKTLMELQEYANRTNIRINDFEQTFDKRATGQYDDFDATLLVQQVKEPYYYNLKLKEEIEHKIRKTRDVIEQLEERVHFLRISKSEFETNFEKINSLFDVARPYLQVEKDV